MDTVGTGVLRSREVWLWLLVVLAAVFASESWGTGGAVAAAVAAAAVATVRTEEVPWSVSLAALGTAGAAAIHFAVASAHLREWWGYGIFFLAAGWTQLAWAALAPRVADRRLLWIGLYGNVTIVVVWALTRTVGLPFGPDSGSTEVVGAPDVVATVLEMVAAAACAGSLVAATRSVGVMRWALGAAGAAATAYVLVSAAGAH